MENEKFQRLLAIKISKYKDEELSDELLQILIDEVRTEMMYAAIFNGGH